MRICEGLSTTVKFLRDSGKLTVPEKFKLAHTAISSVEFHRSLQFLSAYVELCSDKLYSYRDDLDVNKLANGMWNIIEFVLNCWQKEWDTLNRQKFLKLIDMIFFFWWPK